MEKRIHQYEIPISHGPVLNVGITWDTGKSMYIGLGPAAAGWYNKADRMSPDLEKWLQCMSITAILLTKRAF
jgi:hypothetical protein